MIEYEKLLNKAQYEAVTCEDPSVLVVAGAGSGKTRTIVYRLAWLMEQGIDPASVLLLTFTRKAAGEMLARAANLLGYDLRGISGGTFHSFAFNALRRYRPTWLQGRPFTLMDGADITMAIKHCKDQLKLGKGDSSFPKNQTLVNILSKGRNKEVAIDEILRREAFHLLPHAEAIISIGNAYDAYKKEKGLLDYDDLLFGLEELLKSDSPASANLRSRFSHVLVDEYQDTNLVQARIIRNLARPTDSSEMLTSVMAVGDEAQSIYAFRGANVQNILDFPKIFPNARIIALEENYRSTQPILNVANNILTSASQSFRKTLFTERQDGELPTLITPISDLTEARLVTARIEELLGRFQPGEIAVLFRAGFHSYPLENALRQAGIAFKKYGGARFVEAAHIKDLLAFARLTLNPLDLPAFERIAAMHKGIGPKTISRIYAVLNQNKEAELAKALKRFPALLEDLREIDRMRSESLSPPEYFDQLLAYYHPRLEQLYPEDWPSRLQGLEEILRMATAYTDLDHFLADLALESTEESDEEENAITLSTVHSAKGLEWGAVLLLDMVEDRFPSRHAQSREEDFEEERRLFYVACTRAKEVLEIYAPAAIYSRADHGNSLANQSPFLRELPKNLFRLNLERAGGAVTPDIRLHNGSFEKTKIKPSSPKPSGRQTKAGLDPDSAYCRHRIFGKGKIIRWSDSDKVQVDFPGFGVKTILAEYLLPED